MSKAAELAALIGSQASLAMPNLMINGNMQVSQRGTSSTDVPSHSTNYYPLIDQIAVESNNSAGRLTMSQADVTDLAGFTKAMKLDCTTADTSIAADEYFLFEKRIEGQDLQGLGHGTSGAKPVTISFYVKGTANTYMCELQNYDASKISSNQFAVTTSWNRISITVPANTANTISNDNGNGFWLNFWIHAGSTFTGGTYSANAWQSLVNNKRASGIGSFFSSTNNELFITGLQMEIGEVATPFKHETFADNLQRCQRYYQHLGYAYGDVPGSTSNYNGALETPNPSGSYFYGHQSFPVQMRASPTVTLYSTPAGSTETSGVTIDWNSGSSLGSTSVARINSTGYGYLTAGSGASTGAVYRAVLNAEL